MNQNRILRSFPVTRKKAGKRKQRKKKKYREEEEKNKIIDLHPNMSIITLQ